MFIDIPLHHRNSSGIYIIRNSINDKIYIGSAVLFSRRQRQHLHDLRRGKHKSPHLQHHFDKYGESSLTFSILEICPIAELITKEQSYLDTHQPFKEQGFNTSQIAGCTMGYKHTEESKAKMSAAKVGKKPPKAATENARKYWLGRKHSPETYEKMRRAQANKSYDEVARKNMSLAHIGHKQTEETKKKRADILRGNGHNKTGTIVLNTQTGIYYLNVKDAARSFGMVHSTLHRKLTKPNRINNTPFVIV